MGRAIAGRLTVAQLAKREGVHPSTMRRRLHRMDAANGGRILMRNTPGNRRSKLFITLRSVERADKRLVEAKRADADRLESLEKEMRKMKRSISSMRSTLHAMAEAVQVIFDLIESRAKARKRARKAP